MGNMLNQDAGKTNVPGAKATGDVLEGTAIHEDDGVADELTDEDDDSDLSDENLQTFCEEIVLCLMIYGKLDEASARQRLNESKVCSHERNKTVEDRALLFHEDPYFYAMDLRYGREYPYWWNEPSLGNLWPPPEEYDDPDWPNNVLHRIQRE